jgi:hypothetical protein
MKLVNNRFFDKTKKFLDKLRNKIFYGNFHGINSSEICTSEIIIYDEEKFEMDEMKDVFGNSHPYFFEYKSVIPPFYVKIFRNAYCFTNREEIFDSRERCVIDVTSQEINPFYKTSKKYFKKSKIRKINGIVAHLSLSGLENNYGHFLTECLGRYYLIKKSGYEPDYFILSCHSKGQKELIKLLNIDENKIIPTDCNELIQATQLLVPSFINNWNYTIFRGYQHCQKQYLPNWINNLYKFNDTFSNLKSEKKNKIYISRKYARYRHLINESQVVEFLTNFGFEVYNLENLSVKENIKLFSNASIVIGLHGTGFIDMMFSDKNTVIFELFPQYYHDASLRVQAKALNMKYYYMVGESNGEKNINPQKEDVFISISKLREAVFKIFNQNNLN